MGLFSYIGHRIIAIILLVVSACAFLSLAFGAGWVNLVIAVISAIASSYFFKTQH